MLPPSPVTKCHMIGRNGNESVVYKDNLGSQIPAGPCNEMDMEGDEGCVRNDP